jgi:hypothetical protein
MSGPLSAAQARLDAEDGPTASHILDAVRDDVEALLGDDVLRG